MIYQTYHLYSQNIFNNIKMIVLSLKHMWPKKYAFEEIRLKKYLANNKDRFDPHVDSISLNQQKDFWCSLYI